MKCPCAWSYSGPMDSAGDVIRRHREAARMAQDELALAVRVSAGAISQYETGRSHPRRAVAVQLDRVLKASNAILLALGYAPDNDEGNAALVDPIGPDAAKALDLLAELGGEVRGLSRAAGELAAQVSGLQNDQSELRSELETLKQELSRRQRGRSDKT